MPAAPFRVLFATTNGGKLAEGRALLAGLGIDLVGLADVGRAVQVPENAADYEGNARRKAVAWAAESGLATLADDSGLEVDALGGRPGVHSARYGGAGLDDQERTALLLSELEGVSEERRGARFVCVVCLVGASGGVVGEARGERRGVIARTPRGVSGFGYDPVFVIPEKDRSFAELTPEEKACESHRGFAFRRLVASLAARGPGLARLLG